MELWDLLGSSVTVIALPVLAGVVLYAASRGRREPWRTLALVGWLVASGLFSYGVAGSPHGDDGADCGATLTEMRTDGAAGCTGPARTRFTVAALGYVAATAGGALLLRRRAGRVDEAGAAPEGTADGTMRNYFHNK